MRVVVTGQVGLDKGSFLERVCQAAQGVNQSVALCNIGQMMYKEAPDVAPGKILDLPLSRLNDLRRSVFKDVLAASQSSANVIVNTHATFRWRHGLFYAFDYDQTLAMKPDLFIVLADNIDRVHWRLTRDGHVDHTLKDLMVWREEEILATELLSQLIRGHGCCYIMSRGADNDELAAQTVVNLMFKHGRKKAYSSFPMSHVADSPDVLVEINEFRRQMRQFFICFDPGDLEEKYLCTLALKAAEEGRRTVELGPPEERSIMETSQLLDIIADIDGQIYARDFKLIDQADMIVSYIPELPDGRPAISSGVERELQHAHEATKDVFVVWKPRTSPSLFVTETATKVFRSTEEAMRYFDVMGYSNPPAPGALFVNQ